MEDASSPEANYLVLDIETKQDPTARALAGGGKGWRIGLEKLSALAVSPPMQATTSASPACTARAARRIAPTPLAPPSGIVSSQRGVIEK